MPAVVKGIVLDASTRSVLSGVNVVSGSAHTATGTDGRYTLVLTVGEQTIRFSCVGYKVSERKVNLMPGDSMVVDVSLIPVAVLLDEVTVVAERAPRTTIHGLGGFSVSPSRLQTISGPFADAYRLIHTMASVASNNEMSSQFNVRGGSADQNLALLNGAQLLEPFHLKESPNTSVSIVNMELLKKALFVPGGFTARYGDRLSAVLDMEYREGNRERTTALFDASLVNASATVETPFSTWGSGLLSLRSTYSDYVARYLSSGNQRNPSYYDLHAIVGGDIDEQHHLKAQVLHASDKTSGLVDGNYHTTLVSIQSTHTISDRSSLVGGLSSYSQDEDLTRHVSNSLMTKYSDITLWEAKLQFESRISSAYSLTLGAGTQNFSYSLDQRDVFQGSTVDSLVPSSLRLRPTKVAAYMENLVQLTDALLINGGLRFDFSDPNENLFSPRLLLAYRFAGGTTLKGAWGVYYQTANHSQLLAAQRDDLPFQHRQKAVHYVLGIEHPLQRNLSFRLEGYIKTMSDLISFTRRRSGDIIHSSRNDAKGRTVGVEFELSIVDDRVVAWINGAFMRSREYNFFDGKGWRFSPNDQTKTITTVFEYRVAERWLLNVRALYGSGFAYGDDLPGVKDSRLHYPNYTRADARISFAFSTSRAAFTTYLEIMNLFANRNAFSFTGQLKDPNTPDFNLLLPMIVNVGVRIKV